VLNVALRIKCDEYNIGYITFMILLSVALGRSKVAKGVQFKTKKGQHRDDGQKRRN